MIMNDMISRKAAIKAINDNVSTIAEKTFYDCLLYRIPSVDVAPVVHGEWIMRGGKRYCSACGERACVTRDSDDFWYTVGTRFCPNCGAIMDENKTQI